MIKDMNFEGPGRIKRTTESGLIANGKEVFPGNTTYVPTTQLQPGQMVEGKPTPITNIFSNPDGSYRVVFEDADEIPSLDRDDGLNVLNTSL